MSSMVKAPAAAVATFSLTSKVTVVDAPALTNASATVTLMSGALPSTTGAVKDVKAVAKDKLAGFLARSIITVGLVESAVLVGNTMLVPAAMLNVVSVVLTW